jgi:cupin fold WbuC family metalloprotein
MRLRKLSDEVAIADDEIVEARQSDIEILKQQLRHSTLGRTRICTHKQSSDKLHEMLIAIDNRSYIRPHKHLNKSESFHIIQGEVDVVFFHDDGSLSKVIQMGDFASGKTFYYRLADALFHTLLIQTDMVVFHETTNGPFNKGDAVFAEWSPEETNKKEVEAFMRALSERAKQPSFSSSSR